ncbi:MAG: FAD-dependent oxidoreductase [Proteobacteria bacterium]|nr:FAD-dependent oxidoreductase [Pseudomonadota bacterium]
MTLTYSTDIVIFGGGIAGLWLLNRLRSEGYAAILLESDSLGGGQTIASQGIIHGGLKYALSGSITGAASAIADMPARWRNCLQGNGDIDLSECRLLSQDYYMWSNAGIRSKLITFLGSKGLRGRVEVVAKTDYPDFFRQATVAGILYRLPDFVVDTESLLHVLVKNQGGHIFKIDSGAIEFDHDDAGNIDTVIIQQQDQRLQISVQRSIFCAGEGNQALADQAKLDRTKSQTRPLKMVYLKKRELPPVYVHCIGDSFSLTPKLTVTSHTDADGSTVWYLGGELAEAGVKRSDDQQIEAAMKLCDELFPWVDLIGARWQCFTINRAEANVDNDYRPDDACFIEQNNVVVAWPTKFTLTPSLVDKLIDHLAANAVTPLQQSNTNKLSSVLDQPKFATTHWD